MSLNITKPAVQLTTVALVLSALTSGCGGENQEATQLECFDAFAGPDIAECDRQVCVPAAQSWRVEVGPDDGVLSCDGYGGAQHCRGNDVYQAFIFESDDLYLYLSFDPQLVGDLTPAGFESSFEYLWLNVYFPQEQSEEGVFYTQVSARRGIETFESFKYEDGRLKAVFSVEFKSLRQEVQSDDDACFAGDIQGWCGCNYAIGPRVVTFDIDLPVETL